MTDSHDNPSTCCTLPPDALRARGAELEAGLMKKIVAVRELDDGYALRFEPTPGIVEELARFVDFERDCCRFLDFALRVGKEDGPVWLELTGPAAAKTFLAPVIERWQA